MRLNEYLFKELDNILQLICNLLNKIKDWLARLMGKEDRDDFTPATKKKYRNES